MHRFGDLVSISELVSLFRNLPKSAFLLGGAPRSGDEHPPKLLVLQCECGDCGVYPILTSSSHVGLVTHQFPIDDHPLNDVITVFS